ncbi:aldehyde dehydrogenase family protein [Nocardioides sp. MAH-18]|uniref:aldehyde dehydrogenase (NAD(+)) n=1 Tax=Nocardioides agri TaxID=2682843 RepID=A0A6L6XLE3_9ACTN|nr:aldehyde dehydrogenase [Nocardioides sp. CGMCC 1.13656]MBA2953202.1 aldehyde dehydrogenase [Nocardioides sp. CGMCC 1.13656]MVQ48071.1 aldehyde dehydrogenase family protein [Nocardioides sp. MAH-18]
MNDYDKLFIGGRWVDPSGDGSIEVVNPHDGTPVGRVPHATTGDVDAAVAAARTAFESGPWPRLTLEERLAVVERIGSLLTERAPELATLITRQNGSPITFSTRAQAGVSAAIYAVTASIARSYPFEERRDGMRGPVVVRREPVGVVAAVIPWNVPAFAAALKLAPALAAGCTVILKPSPEAPLDANLLAEVAAEAGLPAGVLSVLPADREVSEYLVGHPGVDKVSFTGSVAAGKRVMEVAAGNLSRITLELGGKSAAVLLEDADLDLAVPTIAGASWALNNGQACIALTRVLAPRSRYAEVADRLTAAASALVVGDPMDPATQVGPLVSRRQQERNLDYVRIGQEEGAMLLTGGGVPDGLEDGCYLAPTLFGDVDNSMRIAQEEIFGPVVCLIPYDAEDDAVRIANDSDYGLSGAVFGADSEHALDVARRIRTGTITVNGFATEPTAPFGGFKSSGIGREMGADGLSAFLEAKSVVLAG